MTLCDDRGVIERTQGAQIDHLGLDSVPGQFLGGLRASPTMREWAHQGHPVALAPDPRLADRDQIQSSPSGTSPSWP